MPLLSDPSEVRRYIRSALDSRSAWVFITDAPHVARLLDALRLTLALGGATDAELGFASFHHLNPFTRRRADVTIATLPKSHLPESEARRVLGMFVPSTAPLAGRDLFTIGYDPESLDSILAALLAGKMATVRDPAGN